MSKSFSIFSLSGRLVSLHETSPLGCFGFVTAIADKLSWLSTRGRSERAAEDLSEGAGYRAMTSNIIGQNAGADALYDVGSFGQKCAHQVSSRTVPISMLIASIFSRQPPRQCDFSQADPAEPRSKLNKTYGERSGHRCGGADRERLG